MKDPDASGIEKALAIVQGAAEGFAEQSRDANLPAVVGAAIATVKETVNAVRDELPASATSGGGAESGQGSETAPEDRVFLIEGARPPDKTIPLEHRAEKAVSDLESYAERLRVAAERAGEAPATIGYEVRSTVKETAADAKTAAIGFSLTGILGLFALAFISIVIAMALDRVLGSPWGWLIVGLVYAIGAVIALASARNATRDAKAHVKEGIADVKAEVRSVKDAVRGVRGGTRPGTGS